MVVNLQGDLPALAPEAIRAVVAGADRSGADIATLAAEIDDPADRDNPAVVKAVVAWDADGRTGRALYFTRATAPVRRRPAVSSCRHLCLHPRDALARFVALPPSPLEKREKLEQLRALEANMSIAVARVDRVPLSVDTPADLERANQSAERHDPNPSAAPNASPFRASRAPMPIWRRARRWAMPLAIPEPSFEDAIEAVKNGDCDLCIIPVENSLMGRIADIHHLLPDSGLHIVGEHFLPIRHQLLGLKSAKLDDINRSIPRPRRWRNAATSSASCKLVAHNWYDTAGSAKHVAELKDPKRGGDRLDPGGRTVRPQSAQGRCRGRASQHDALPHHGARAGRCAGRRPQDRHHLCFPGEERARRALQGDGRLRHQWRQHDQAGILPAGRLVQRHAILCRYPGPSRTIRR